jgi:ankyrin repeat protein
MYASDRGHAEVVKLLLAARENVHLRNKVRVSFLCYSGALALRICFKAVFILAHGV